jgi:hypothetical protein
MWGFITTGRCQIQVCVVDNPPILGSPNQIFTVEDRSNNVAVWSAVRVADGGQQRESFTLFDVERSALSTTEEGEQLIVGQYLCTGCVRTG